jgi:hypothetical protein
VSLALRSRFSAQPSPPTRSPNREDAR